nr:MAG TPA: baseplate protein [Caudoviricetes sp.]
MTRLSVSSGDIWANVDFPDLIELGKQISFTKASNRPDAIAIALSIYSPDIYLSPEVAGPGVDRHKMTLQIGLSETSTSFSIPLSSWAEVPNKNTITFRVEAVAITTSGIGTTANATVYAVADQSLAPTFALDISPSSDAIQGVTPVSISISGESLKYGASVASRSINADGRSSADTSLAITPTSSGAISVSATVKDSRGLSATKTATFNVTAYSPPALRSFVVSRVDSNGSPDAEGTSVKFVVVWESGSGDTGDNSCTVKYRQAGLEAYIDCGEVVSGQEYVITSDVFSTDFEYEFVAAVSDKHKPLEKTAILEMAFFTLDFLTGGRGMAVGCASTKEGFECAMPARFVDSVEFAKRGEVFGHMSSLGANITGGAANDTRDFWAAQGNGVAYFSQTGMLNGQPAQYGFLINIVSNNGINGSIVAQEFWWLTEGYHYKRGMNVAGAMPSWIRIFDLGSGALPVANGGTGVTSDAAIGLKAYPVGAVYISYNSTSPASLFGGSWTAITGRFPYFNAGTGTGGSNTHTLTTTEMPSHSHTLAGYGYAWVAAGAANVNANSSSKVGTISCASTGGGGSHNNMPAYQTLYAWRRTG